VRLPAPGALKPGRSLNTKKYESASVQPPPRDSQGLESLRVVGDDVEIGENAALCEDEVDALLAQLTLFSGRGTTTGNTSTCLSS